MLSVYDLYDLHAIFVAIRCYPNDEVNQAVISNVLDVLRNRYNNDEQNQFRIAIRSIDLINEKELYKFVLTENEYCYFPLPFLKSEKIYMVFIKACEELLKAVSEKNAEKTFDLADCLHNLPIIIAGHNYSIPKSYWKNEIKEYRKKWGKDFLANEQKIRKDTVC